MFTNTLKTDVELWRSEAQAGGYTVREGQGRWHVYRVGYDAPIANCGDELGALRVAFAMAKTFSPVKQKSTRKAK